MAFNAVEFNQTSVRVGQQFQILFVQFTFLETLQKVVTYFVDGGLEASLHLLEFKNYILEGLISFLEL